MKTVSIRSFPVTKIDVFRLAGYEKRFYNNGSQLELIDNECCSITTQRSEIE